MNCRRADQLFSAAWEDELTLVEREALESHMSGCAECRRAYDEFVRVMEAVQGMPRAEAASDFSEGVWSRIRAAEAPAARRRRVLSFGWAWGSLRPALAAAACLVVVGGAIAYWNATHANVMQRPVASPSRAIASPLAQDQPTPAQSAPAPAQVATTQSSKALPVTAEPRNAARDESASQLAKASLPSDQHVGGGRASEMAFSAPVAAHRDSAVNDSLFDHRYDMEFALDPVHLKKTGKGRLTPASPVVPTDVEGKPAKVTF